MIHIPQSTLLLTSLFLLSVVLAHQPYYALFLKPASPITAFTATLSIPGTSPGEGKAVWTGLEPKNGAQVLQNVVHYSNGWLQEPIFCCSPNLSLRRPSAVSPGDTLLSIYKSENSTSEWNIKWYNDAAGSDEPYSSPAYNAGGQLDFDPRKFGNNGPMTNALFAIELPGNNTWDFGPVVWNDIAITANTNGKADWCGIFLPTSDFSYSVSGASVTIYSDGSTMCQIKTLVFEGPD